MNYILVNQIKEFQEKNTGIFFPTLENSISLYNVIVIESVLSAETYFS